MTATNFDDLVRWALHIRREPTAGRVRQVLAAAAAPDLIDRALGHPAVSARLATVPEHQRPAAVSALGVIVQHKHLHHSDARPLGHALARLQGTAAAEALAAAAGASRRVAVRLLGNALDQAGNTGPVNLVDFTGLITWWDDLTIRERSQFLVDFHTADRA